MSDHKHTPGPWTATHDDYGDNLCVMSGEVYVVAGCGCCGSPSLDSKNFAADARLIANAPDLLAVCEKVRDMLLSETCDAVCMVVPAVDALNAVIAKATGETNA